MVEGSFEGHAPPHVPFIGRLSRVEGSRKTHAFALICFVAYTALCGLFLDFCPRFGGSEHF
jgi:amino acid transporter